MSDRILVDKKHLLESAGDKLKVMKALSRFIVVTLSLAAVALFISACGGGDDNSTTPAVAPGAAKVSQGESPDQAPETGGGDNSKFPISNPDRPPKQNKPAHTPKRPDKSSQKQAPGHEHGKQQNHNSPGSNRSGHGSTAAPAPEHVPVSPVHAPQVQPLTPAQKQSKALRVQQHNMDHCLQMAAVKLGLASQWNAGTLNSEQMLNVNIKAQKCIAKSAAATTKHIIGPPPAPKAGTGMHITKPGQVNK